MCTGPHPFIPTPNVFQVRIRYSVTEGKMENDFYVTSGNTPGLGDYQAVAAIVGAWWDADYKQNISDQVSHSSTMFRDVSQPNQPSVEISRVPTAGAQTGDSLPYKDSFAIKKSSYTGGRRRDGRVYVFGITESQTNKNSVHSLVASFWRGSWDNLRTLLDNDGYTMGWVSYCLNKVWRVQGLFIPINEFVVTDFLIDSQNRRKPNVGS